MPPTQNVGRHGRSADILGSPEVALTQSVASSLATMGGEALTAGGWPVGDQTTSNRTL